MHGDLHSGNVLLSLESNRCLCKIADFGRSEQKTLYGEGQDIAFFLGLIHEIRVATHFKNPEFDSDLKEMGDLLLGGRIRDIIHFDRHITDHFSRL